MNPLMSMVSFTEKGKWYESADMITMIEYCCKKSGVKIESMADLDIVSNELVESDFIEFDSPNMKYARVKERWYGPVL